MLQSKQHGLEVAEVRLSVGGALTVSPVADKFLEGEDLAVEFSPVFLEAD